MICERHLPLAIQCLRNRAEADRGKDGQRHQGRDKKDEEGLAAQGRQRSLHEAQHCISTHAHTLPAVFSIGCTSEKMRRWLDRRAGSCGIRRHPMTGPTQCRVFAS